MKADSPRWKEVTPSQYPWEREALEFVRERLPDRDPFLAWSNFEFIGEDGSINEVDLLVLSPRGLFLVEIKSRPGVVEGDAGTWTWTHEGRRTTLDNPTLLANRKAKRLASLLRGMRAFSRGRPPFVEARVFLSAAGLRCQLDARTRLSVHLRDRPQPQPGDPPGIVSVLTEGAALGAGLIDRNVARQLSQAMEQAGIRPHEASRRVGDYVLEKLLGEGQGFQDWEAGHVSLPKVRRRIRLYPLARAESASSREQLRRAAQREFQILEGIQHAGILKAVDYRDHERGPALVFEHSPGSMRLDYFLRERGERLSLDVRLQLLRQVAEAIQHAHRHKLYHRALSPQSILVVDPEAPQPRVQVFNWQSARREATGRSSTGTTHLGELVEDAARVYMAPEAFTDLNADPEALDVFSLGALAHLLFSGTPPAKSAVELVEKLREGDGLRLASVLDGAAEALQLLVLTSTSPSVTSRLESVAEFLGGLDQFEEELTRPEPVDQLDPLEAKAGDQLGRFKVKKRLGKGATSVALLVEEQGRECVLKVALNPEQHDRLRAEADALSALTHQHVCGFRGLEEIGGRLALVLDKAGDETLGQRLRREGPLHVDLLQRFGEDLLQTIDWLEQKGIPHRDVKPDNIGISPVGRGDRLHLVLFDFSLSRTPAENIRAGTVPYLDPFLSLRRPARWDLHAERFAAAMTLYEMATGTLPRWGDGHSDPAVIDDEAALDAERFDPDLRDGLLAFFQRALRRDWQQRFGNAEEMLRAWQQVFTASVRRPQPTVEGEPWPAISAEALAQARLDTPLSILGLGTRALNALERVNVTTVSGLLSVPSSAIYHMRGVGHKTRRELADAITQLAARFPDHPRTGAPAAPATEDEDSLPADVQSLDLIVGKLVPKPRRGTDTSETRGLQALLGLDESRKPRGSWTSQTDVARRLGVTRARVGQIIAKARARWGRQPALSNLGDEVAQFIDSQGGVVSAGELVAAILTVRGSAEAEPRRSQVASAVGRAVVEAEQTQETPRFVLSRSGDVVLVASSPELADYAGRLGEVADRLAALEPLASPARVLESLEAIKTPAGLTPLSQSRLAPLAVAASSRAALSSRLEIYPRQMDALRALKLAQQALLVPQLTVEDLAERVRSRYPEAQPLPPRPQLDGLLREAGLGLTWNPAALEGRGVYRTPLKDFQSVSFTPTLLTPIGSVGPAGQPNPEAAEARQFHERLQHSLKRGGFLALTVEPRHLRQAEKQLLADFPVRRHSLEERLIEEMRRAASTAGAEWDVVRRADAAGPDSSEWRNLMLLVARAVAPIEQDLAAAQQPTLLVRASLLARYDQVGLLTRLRDVAGHAGRVPTVWVLLASDGQQALPVLDGKAIPVLTTGECARIPDGWLHSLHRTGAPPAA